MRKLKTFTGINNVLEPEQLDPKELRLASNVDFDLEGNIRRRAGFTTDTVTVHKNLWKANGFDLATRGAGGDLVNVDTAAVLHAGLGHTPRVWFSNLPDGRTLYGNGVTQGVVNAAGSAVATWGIPLPVLTGIVASNAVGNLTPGDYQWSITHVRLADGAESGPEYKAGAVAVTTGGISFTGIPVPAGHKANVYLTSRYGGTRYLAGSTTNGSFSFTGQNSDLQLACKTEFLSPPPAGKHLGFWRGSSLVAVGSALCASIPHSWELFNLQRDFKPFSGDLTMVIPVRGGIWVGTTKELAFLAGDKWDTLLRVPKMGAGVVLGSGCVVPGKHIKNGDGRSEDDGMVCIADGWLVAGLPDGSIVPLTLDRYRTDVTEVAAAFRVVDSVPQYIALPQ